MNYSKDISVAVESFFKADGWTYDFDEELGVYESGAVIKNHLGYAPIVIFIRENAYTVYMDIDAIVPEEKRLELAKWVTETNCGMIIGSFEMDYNRGTLRFKCTVDCQSIQKRKSSGIR